MQLSLKLDLPSYSFPFLDHIPGYIEYYWIDDLGDQIVDEAGDFLMFYDAP
jgi:hypothetical protein|tara:strand:- start:242 stop:394 length:153 start_codon:yes stop_codon:yes gene_type:complete